VPVRKVDSSGFTLLEVIVALFIFGCISAALLKALSAADRIQGRASLVTNASMLAENEIESIRSKAFFFEALEDCTYTAAAGSGIFQVDRRVIPHDNFSIEDKPEIMEIEVTVKENSQSSGTLVRYRFLQGYQQ